MRRLFSAGATWISEKVGSPLAFTVAATLVAVWLVSGPAFGYSEAWQLVINTGTTIVTFLMVFLIQNAQNRQEKAIQLKLDELLKAVRGARTGLVGLESLSDEDLDALQKEFENLRRRHAAEVASVTAGASEHVARETAEDTARRTAEEVAGGARSA